MITANLTRDAVLKEVAGTKVLEFSLADEIGFGDKKTKQYIRCSLWGKRGESLARYMKKGSMVEVCGTPKINSYKTKAGDFKAEIDVSVLELKLKGGGPKASVDNTVVEQIADDEIPF
jgi:single-strand DNA-binding protein